MGAAAEADMTSQSEVTVSPLATESCGCEHQRPTSNVQRPINKQAPEAPQTGLILNH
jgi:hypothetical protein